MGTFRVQMPPTGTLEEALARMPTNVKGFMRDGFNILARATDIDFDELSAVVLEAVQSGFPPTDAGLPRLGLAQEDARHLLSSLSLAASLFSTRQENAEQFVDSAISTKIVEPSRKGLVLSFLTAVAKNKPAFARSIEQSRIASEVLPSFFSLEVAVDMRLGFDKGRVTNSIPVAVVHFDTDAENQEIWFQLNKRQLEKTIRDLEEALRKLEQAEKWASQNSATKE